MPDPIAVRILPNAFQEVEVRSEAVFLEMDTFGCRLLCFEIKNDGAALTAFKVYRMAHPKGTPELIAGITADYATAGGPEMPWCYLATASTAKTVSDPTVMANGAKVKLYVPSAGNAILRLAAACGTVTKLTGFWSGGQ